MDFIDVVQTWCGRERIALCSHCVLATSVEFSPRRFHVSAMTMVRSCHVVEDSITLFIRSFGSLHVCCTFAVGSHHVYIALSEFSINSGSNSSHHNLCFNYVLNLNQELLQFVLHQALFHAQAALVLVRRKRRRNRRQSRSCWVHSFTYVDTRNLAERMRTRRARRSIYRIRKDTMRTCWMHNKRVVRSELLE